MSLCTSMRLPLFSLKRSAKRECLQRSWQPIQTRDIGGGWFVNAKTKGSFRLQWCVMHFNIDFKNVVGYILSVDILYVVCVYPQVFPKSSLLQNFVSVLL